MTIHVPFRLRRRATAQRTVALYIATREPASLVAICEYLGLDPSRRVFDVADGYLIRLESPSTQLVPGAIRLRELTAAFYVPVDADLIPALLDDEAAGLVRDWGLVFLPDGRVLLFDRQCPIDLNQLLELEPRMPRTWSSLPEPRRLADRIDQIALELPEQQTEDIYRGIEDDLHGNSPTGTPVDDTETGGGTSESDRAAAGAGLTGEGWVRQSVAGSAHWAELLEVEGESGVGSGRSLRVAP